jgi:hypothetical protein
MEQNAVPARLHAILASKSPYAIVIRRGNSKQTAAILWNRQDDSFTIGQWLKGKIYHYRCDISPNGKYWIYFALGKGGKTYTAAALTPYLNAIDFYEKNDAWNGGGLFLNDKTYWLNESGRFEYTLKRKSFLKVSNEYPNYPNAQSECPYIYSIRLERDGWECEDWNWDNVPVTLTKKIDDVWRLIKLFFAGGKRPIGKGVYYEEHKLLNVKSGEEIKFSDWEWEDMDGDRLVFAERGKIYAAQIGEILNGEKKELYDFNNMKFEAIKAPY